MSVDSLRRELISNSRIVCLRKLFDLRVSQRTFTFQVMRDHYLSLFFCRHQETFPGVSQLSQNATFLVNHIIEHPSDFAETVVKHSSAFDFATLINETVPSIYGFFTCKEQLLLASRFYKHVITKAKPELAVRILQPFFNSPATFRFREHAFDQFFRGFLLDLSYTSERDRPSLVPIHSVNLLECFTAALPLLPTPHLELLRMLRRPNFPGVHFTNLFLINFLWASAVDWLESLHFGQHLPFLRRVLSDVGAQPDALRRFYAEISRTVCIAEVPELFQLFDHSYLLYFFSVNDVLFIARVLSDQKKLPRGLTLAEFGEIDPRYRDHWFWCQVFPKVESAPKEPRGQLGIVFTSWIGAGSDYPSAAALVEDAADFEKFLEYRDKYEGLKHWARLVQTEVTLLMRIYIEYLKGIKAMLLPLEIRQLLEIRELNSEFIARHQRRLLEVADRWNAITTRYRSKFDLKNVLVERPATRNLIWEAIRRIMSTNSPDLLGFPMFIKSIVQFHTISLELNLGTPLLCCIIAQMPFEALLVPFVLLTGTIGGNATEFLTPVQNFAWDAIGACMMKMFQDDQVLMARFLEETVLIKKR